MSAHATIETYPDDLQAGDIYLGRTIVSVQGTGVYRVIGYDDGCSTPIERDQQIIVERPHTAGPERPAAR